MAYQSLNIIGSFTAGTAFVQNQVQADRDRVEAYRSMLRQQVGGAKVGVNDADSLIDDIDDRMAVGDAPEEQRSPYLLRQRYTQPKPNEDGQAQTPTVDAVPGSQLDTVV